MEAMNGDLAAMTAFAEARLAEDEARARRGNPDWRIFPQGSRPLREVEAKRKILAEHKAVVRLAGLTGQELGFLGWYREWVVRNLIAVWSDHPDYLPSWAPAAVGG